MIGDRLRLFAPELLHLRSLRSQIVRNDDFSYPAVEQALGTVTELVANLDKYVKGRILSDVWAQVRAEIPNELGLA